MPEPRWPPDLVTKVGKLTQGEGPSAQVADGYGTDVVTNGYLHRTPFPSSLME